MRTLEIIAIRRRSLQLAAKVGANAEGTRRALRRRIPVKPHVTSRSRSDSPPTSYLQGQIEGAIVLPTAASDRAQSLVRPKASLLCARFVGSSGNCLHRVWSTPPSYLGLGQIPDRRVPRLRPAFDLLDGWRAWSADRAGLLILYVRDPVAIALNSLPATTRLSHRRSGPQACPLDLRDPQRQTLWGPSRFVAP